VELPPKDTVGGLGHMPPVHAMFDAHESTA